MVNKENLGRFCEELVKNEIIKRTKYDVVNLNDIRNNYPVVDLKVTNFKTDVSYDVSVKAKTGDRWPAVKGIRKENQFIVFVDYSENQKAVFYILNYLEWISTLKQIKSKRTKGSKIIDGALEWNWEKDGVSNKFRGSWLFADDINEFKSCWKTLPGCK
jgi:hypothetical protein